MCVAVEEMESESCPMTLNNCLPPRPWLKEGGTDQTVIGGSTIDSMLTEEANYSIANANIGHGYLSL
jgi:hypothetical protein